MEGLRLAGSFRAKRAKRCTRHYAGFRDVPFFRSPPIRPRVSANWWAMLHWAGRWPLSRSRSGDLAHKDGEMRMGGRTEIKKLGENRWQDRVINQAKRYWGANVGMRRVTMSCTYYTMHVPTGLLGNVLISSLSSAEPQPVASLTTRHPNSLFLSSSSSSSPRRQTHSCPGSCIYNQHIYIHIARVHSLSLVFSPIRNLELHCCRLHSILSLSLSF